MSDSFGYVDLTFGENDEQLGAAIKRFKAKGGENYRMSLAWWEIDASGALIMEGTPKFKAAMRHYFPGIGYVLHKGPEFTKLSGDEPRVAIATVVILWPTDRDGQLDEAKFKAHQGEVMIWAISREKYNQLKRIAANGFPFSEFDLSVSCTDTQYQKMSFTPIAGGLLKKIMESTNPKIKEWAAKIIGLLKEAGDKVASELAKDLTLQQLRERLQGGDGGPVSATGAVATEDVDNMIDDILES